MLLLTRLSILTISGLLTLAACAESQSAVPLEAMTKRAVLDEPHMDTGHVMHEQRLVDLVG